MTFPNLVSNWGLKESLTVPVRWGLRSVAAQIRCTAEGERLLCRAIVRQLHRPHPLGGTHHFVEHCFDSVDQQFLGSPGPVSLLEAGKSQIQNPRTQQPHGHMAGAQLSGYRLAVFAIGGKQSDTGPPY
jgi:hypothetical protein